jgi:hypothetical protein
MIGKLGAGSKRHIGKYLFVHKIIQLWNQLPADTLGTPSCASGNFRKYVRNVINMAK